jgi:hypothetical protein
MRGVSRAWDHRAPHLRHIQEFAGRHHVHRLVLLQISATTETRSRGHYVAMPAHAHMLNRGSLGARKPRRPPLKMSSGAIGRETSRPTRSSQPNAFTIAAMHPCYHPRAQRLSLSGFRERTLC